MGLRAPQTPCCRNPPCCRKPNVLPPFLLPFSQAYTALLAQCGGSYRERQQLAAFIKAVQVGAGGSALSRSACSILCMRRAGATSRPLPSLRPASRSWDEAGSVGTTPSP